MCVCVCVCVRVCVYVCVLDNFHEPSVNETLGNLIYHLSRGNEGKRVHFELSAECVCACVWVGERGRGRENGREREKEEVDISIFWGESNCRNTHFKVIPTPQAPESFLKRIRSWLLAKKQSKTSSWKRGLPFLLVHFRKKCTYSVQKKNRFFRLGVFLCENYVYEVLQAFQDTGGPCYMREIGTPKIGSHIMNLHMKRPRITIN